MGSGECVPAVSRETLYSSDDVWLGSWGGEVGAQATTEGTREFTSKGSGNEGETDPPHILSRSGMTCSTEATTTAIGSPTEVAETSGKAVSITEEALARGEKQPQTTSWLSSTETTSRGKGGDVGVVCATIDARGSLPEQLLLAPRSSQPATTILAWNWPHHVEVGPLPLAERKPCLEAQSATTQPVQQRQTAAPPRLMPLS